MTERKKILEAKGVSKSYHYPSTLTILNEVSIDLFSGESIAIMGRSGEGKSTLLHILGSLEEPTAGALFIHGEEVTKNNAPRLRNQHIGFVFQAFNLLEDYTVLENVLMPSKIAGHSFTEMKERGMDLLEKVGLTHRAHFATKLLSGGEKQRVAIARALCNDPQIILADEPSGNLDQGTSGKIHEILINCTLELKKGLIIVTHHQELASLCDRKLNLSAGHLV